MSGTRWRHLGLVIVVHLGMLAAVGQPFHLPTHNQALFEAGGAARYFAPTAVGEWTSGLYGCVRTDGRQFHEGIDILHEHTDQRGEPTDPVFATTQGRVVYINTNPGLSNYGIYVILEHQVDGIEIHSIYAHLSEVQPGLKPGSRVRTGQELGIMGRTANTRSTISKARAHLHFELAIRLSNRFTAWQKARYKGQRNDHGEFNGRNFLGLDPIDVFREQAARRSDFNLATMMRDQTELCRVLARKTDLSILRRLAPLVERNPRAEREGTAGYELALNYAGIPCRIIPRAPSEISGKKHGAVLSVNDAERQTHRCRSLVVRSGNGWGLGRSGEQLLDLLTY
jgi:hypothetical protein